MRGPRDTWQIRAMRPVVERAQPVTPRQAAILTLVAADRGDKEIAYALGISRRTVRTHLERFYRLHGVHGRAGAVARWIELGGRVS